MGLCCAVTMIPHPYFSYYYEMEIYRRMNLKNLIGDKAFYRRVVLVAGPILIQNVITNFVNLLDNVMVGQVGTEPMSGVAIVNQLLFVFNLCIFGAHAGPGIFSAQYFGKGDLEGVRRAFRTKLYLGLAAVAVFISLFLVSGESLIRLFLHEGQDALDLNATLGYGMDYLGVIIFQMVPFVISQSYASTLRETGETVLPMKAGIAAVFVNMTFNYILIFGKLGAPAMGVVGAAIATVMSRVVECAIMVIYTHTRKQRCPFAEGLYRSLSVPKALLKQIAVVGLPLLANELLWAAGMTILNQCYSVRGLEVVSACNIASTVSNLFFCVFFAIGNAICIMVGQLLGAGQLEQAVEEDRKLIAFSFVLNIAVGLIMAILAPVFPRVYNTTDTVKSIAAAMLTISACLMPINAVTHAAYFTLRTGGKTVITFLFDCGFMWVICIPIAFCLSRFTCMSIRNMFLCVQSLELVKCVVGIFLLRSKIWVNNLVKD